MKFKKPFGFFAVGLLTLGLLPTLFNAGAVKGSAEDDFTVYGAKDFGLSNYGTTYTFANSGDGQCIEGNELSEKSELTFSYKGGVSPNYYFTVGGYGVYVSTATKVRFISQQYSSTYTRNYTAYNGDSNFYMKSEDGTALTDVIRGGTIYSDFVDVDLKVDLTGENAVISYHVTYDDVVYYPYSGTTKCETMTATTKVSGISDCKFRLGSADNSTVAIFRNDSNDDDGTALKSVRINAESLYQDITNNNQTEIALSEDKSHLTFTCTAGASDTIDPSVTFGGSTLSYFREFDSLWVEYQLEANEAQTGNIYWFTATGHSSCAVTAYTYNADRYLYVNYPYTIAIGAEITSFRYDYIINSFTGGVRVKSFVFQNQDGHASSGLAQDEEALKDFNNDGQFTFEGNKLGTNGYLSSPVLYNEEQAAKNGVPEGYTGAVLKLNPVTTGGIGFNVDFAPAKIDISDIKNITIRFYLATANATETGYPKLRVFSEKRADATQIIGNSSSDQNGCSVGSGANAWQDFVLDDSKFNSGRSWADLASIDDSSVLGKFHIHFRVTDSSMDTMYVYIDSITVNLVERSTFAFTGVAPGWNNTVTNGTDRQTILYYGIWGTDFFGSGTSSVNRATDAYDIGKKMTINGIPMSRISGATITYAHGYSYLYFSTPYYALYPTNGYKVTTLDIPEGTKFVSNCCGETTLYLVNDVWTTVAPETTSDENYRSLSDVTGESIHAFGETLYGKDGLALPSDTLNFKCAVRLGSAAGDVTFTFYDAFGVYFSGSQVRILNGKTPEKVVTKTIDTEDFQLFEIEATLGDKVHLRVGLNGLYVAETDLSLTLGSASSFRAEGSDGVVLKNYDGSDFRGPILNNTGMTHYYFNAGSAVYDFTNVITAYDLKDGDVSSSLSYVYEDGAVTDGKYNAGNWTLVVQATDNDGNVTETTIRFTIYGGAEALVTVTFDGENPVTVKKGETITAPEDPDRESDAANDYSFLGWYSGETKWDFGNPVLESMNLVSRFDERVRHYTVSIVYEGARTGSYSLSLIYGASLDFALFEAEKCTYVVKDGNGNEIENLIVSGDVTLTVTYTEIHEHTYTYVEEVAATPEHDGVMAHYVCEGCGKLFLKEGDEYVEVSEEDLVIKYVHEHTYTYVEEVAATPEHDGVMAHYICEECGKLFLKEGDEYVEVTEEDLRIPYEAPDEPVKKKGCGGSIIATSALVSLVSLTGIILVTSRKKEDR